MDLDELNALSRSLSRDEFAARFKNLFFILDQPKADPSRLEFETAVADPRSRASLVAGPLRVVAIVKAPNSPYSDRISIGRARNCDVVLRDPSISKLHAHVRMDGGQWAMVDLGSHNGTLVRGEKLVPNEPARLKSGDLVTFGSVTVRVVDAAALHRLLLGFR